MKDCLIIIAMNSVFVNSHFEESGNKKIQKTSKKELTIGKKGGNINLALSQVQRKRRASGGIGRLARFRF